MKKIFSTIISSPLKGRLCGLLFALLATTNLWAYDFQFGDLYYNITSSSEPYTVEVGGAESSITTVIIPESVTYNGTTYSVTSIGNYAFQYCSSLTSITITNSVTTIGKYAFSGCSSLTSITIGNSVTSIGNGAFQDCSSLTSITIPNSVTSIGKYAFLECSSLTSVTIGNSVTSIGYAAFSGCSSLTSVIIPNSVTSIGEYAFSYCSSLTSTTIPNSVTNIGKYAFSGCSSLTSIVVENGNTTYDSRENCNAIIETATNALINGCRNTFIPNSVTSIGEGAFRSCSFTSITIPNSVTSIGKNAFYGCSFLTSITIPNSVTSIGESAFEYCSSFTSITIGNSVTSIGKYVFLECSSLTSMTVENGNTVYDSRENCNAIIEIATNTLIAGCQNTIIPNSVTSIGDYAFCDCSSLTSLTIPNSVTSIGGRAFYGCSSLTSITIPNSVTSIGKNAFVRCSSLTSMNVENGNTHYDSREDCNAIIETATNTLIAGCQNTIIPNSVTSIGDFAFTGCSSLTSITIPNSVTSIGGSAFFDCFSLKTVICEAIEVPELGYDVFYDMPLSEATLYVPAQSLDDYKAAEQWKEFGTILPIEGESEEEIELQDTEMTIVFTNSEDNDSEIYRQTLTIKVPIAPTIAGFTFLYWQPVAEPITNEITIQAIYEANVPSSVLEVYVNPANPTQKLLRNGQVYILQDGKTYTITGQKL